uniref:Uncharacterized protein n=1 Tax=Ascaris lumbricoides TaxID=6252 RepID=A0A0M3HM80_ASCLU
MFTNKNGRMGEISKKTNESQFNITLVQLRYTCVMKENMRTMNWASIIH